MSMVKSKFGLLLILGLVLMASVSARVYIPQDVNQNYPEFASADSSGNLEIFSFNAGGSNNTGNAIANSVGPIADFDNDSEMEVAGVKSGNNNYQINIYKRSTGNVDHTFVESGTVKASQRPIAVGNIDNDVYPDIIYSDSSGYTSWVDYDTSFKHLNGVKKNGYLGDVADIDKDGYREIVQNSGSQSVQIYNYISADNDNTIITVSDTTSYSVSKKGSSALADIDGDNYLEYTFNTNGGTMYMYDKQNLVTSYDDQGALSSLKNRRHGYTITDFLPDGGQTDIETVAAGNNKYMLTCDEGTHGCESKTPFGQEIHQNFHSYIPPSVEGPELNTTTPEQGMTIQLKFNASDSEGYTDILNYTAKANFTWPDGSSHVKEAAEFTEQSEVNTISGQDNKIVPNDGKTKAFKTSFKIPENAETGQWNVSVQVKDEKMTGTKNWTTFQVEKAMEEGNVSQSISVGRKDTSRQTSLGKSQITGLSFASTSLTDSFTNRLLTESLGFSSGKDRKQSLDKSVDPVLAFSRSGSNFKSTFPVFSSDIVAGSTVSDIFSTKAILSPVFGLGSSTPTGIALSRSFDPILNFAPESQAQQTLLRLSENRIYASGSFSGVIVKLLDYSLGISSSQYRAGMFERILMEDVILEESYSNNLSLYRDINQNLSAQSSLSGTGLFFASVSPSISIGQSLIVTQELFRSITQTLLLGEQQDDVFETSRGQETSIGASTGISTGQIIYRSFTQPLITDAGANIKNWIEGLVNEAKCRIFGSDSDYCETNDDQNDQDTDNGGSENGGGSGGGSIGGIGTGDNLNNDSKDNESSGKQGDEKESEDIIDESEQIKKIEASLKPSGKVNNIEKLGNSFENLDRGQKVVVETSEDADGSSGSSGSSTENKDMVEVEEVSFEVKESKDKSELVIKTVGSPEKLNLSVKNDEIYEATSVSTQIGTANATLVYEVEKEFLSRNNASIEDIVVSRWTNESKVEELRTKISNESEDAFTVESKSPNGFSIFVVSLSQDKNIKDEKGLSIDMPSLPTYRLIKLALLLTSLYLIRKPIIRVLFTLDIRFSHLVQKIRFWCLIIYNRILRRDEIATSRKDLELYEEVNSLKNQKEVLEFRKNQLEKEVENKREIREKYRRNLSKLSRKIEKWEEKLRD